MLCRTSIFQLKLHLGCHFIINYVYTSAHKITMTSIIDHMPDLFSKSLPFKEKYEAVFCFIWIEKLIINMFNINKINCLLFFHIQPQQLISGLWLSFQATTLTRFCASIHSHCPTRGPVGPPGM